MFFLPGRFVQHTASSLLAVIVTVEIHLHHVRDRSHLVVADEEVELYLSILRQYEGSIFDPKPHAVFRRHLAERVLAKKKGRDKR